MAVTIEIPGPPRPKARPRPNPAGGVWSPSKGEEERVAGYLLRFKGLFPEGPVGMACEFHVNSRSRADVDNLVKLVKDAAEKAGVYTNDFQVTKSYQKRVVVSSGMEKTIVWLGRPEEMGGA